MHIGLYTLETQPTYNDYTELQYNTVMQSKCQFNAFRTTLKQHLSIEHYLHSRLLEQIMSAYGIQEYK